MFKKQFFYDSHEPPFLRGISEDCGSLNKYSPTLLLITGPYPLLIVSLFLSFLAGTYQSPGGLPSGLNQTSLNESSKPLVIIIFLGQGCCMCLFTITSEEKNNRSVQVGPMNSTFTPLCPQQVYYHTCNVILFGQFCRSPLVKFLGIGP